MLNVAKHSSIVRKKLVPLILIRYLWALCNLSYLTGNTGLRERSHWEVGAKRQSRFCHERPQIKSSAALMKLSAIPH